MYTVEMFLWDLYKIFEFLLRAIFKVNKWDELFKEIITREDFITQQRGLYALANMMEIDYDVAAKIVQTDLIDVKKILCIFLLNF